MTTDLKTPPRSGSPNSPGQTLADDDGLRDGDPIPPMRADKHSTNHPAVETPVEARQGFLGRPVLMVLAGGLLLSVAAWLVVGWLAY